MQQNARCMLITRPAVTALSLTGSTPAVLFKKSMQLHMITHRTFSPFFFSVLTKALHDASSCAYEIPYDAFRKSPKRPSL